MNQKHPFCKLSTNRKYQKQKFLGLSTNRKAQVSFEYLQSYMWVFIIVLVAIGAMSYYGLFKTDRLAGEKCNFDANFFCHDFVVMKTSADLFDLTLLLQNNMDSEIYLNQTRLYDIQNKEISCVSFKLYCRFNESTHYIESTPSNAMSKLVDPSKQWIKTRLCRLDFEDCNKTLINNEKETIIVLLNFSGVDSDILHTSLGRVFASVYSN
ncbi:MAG: hypothetical protein ABIB43_00635 [archaeon]